MTPSDISLIIDLILALVFLIYFAAGKPRVWHRDRLGWVIFGYGAAVVALLFLIVYGIVFGQKVDEPVRFLVGAGLAAALVGKINAVHNERRAGRLDNVRPPTPKEKRIMNDQIPAVNRGVALAIGETVTSDSPKVELGKAKAVVAAVGGALVGGLSALGVALADERITSGEWVAVALAFVLGSGLVGGATYVAKTTVTGSR